MKGKTSNLKLVLNFINALDREERAEWESKLKNRGINPSSLSVVSLFDYAYVADNKSKVERYIKYCESEEINFAKESNGKYAGRLEAVKLEARRLKSIGLSTTNPKRLKTILSKIEKNKHTNAKKKKPRKVNNRRALAAIQLNKLMDEYAAEEDRLNISPVKVLKEGMKFDPDEIDDFARRAFMPE